MKRFTNSSYIVSAPQNWSNLPQGSIYQQSIQTYLDPWLPRFFGFHFIKLGALSIALDTTSCAINHQIKIAPEGDNLDLKASYYQLPIIERTVDACLIAHVLPYVDNPHRLLYEVDRVLLEDGWLVITGFNPYSLLGIGKIIPGLSKRQPYSSNMLTRYRLFDWLRLLNYEIIDFHCCQAVPCYPNINQLLDAHIPAIGCLQFIVARKRTFPLTLDPLKRRQSKLAWQRKTVTATANKIQ